MFTIEEALHALNLIDLDESAKTDFIDKFGQDTFNNFEKAKQRLINKGLSADYGTYLKKNKKEIDDLIISLYDKEKDQEKVRVLKGTQRNVRGKYNFLGEVDGYLVYEPLDYISSMDLGINTGWCTTGRYGHAGHPEFTPSAKDAKMHFNDYTNPDSSDLAFNDPVKLYYFLDPKTFYGKYAIAIGQTMVGEWTVTKVIDRNGEKKGLTERNYKLFNAEDDEIAWDNAIIQIAKKLNLGVKYTLAELDNDYIIKETTLVKSCSEDECPQFPKNITKIGPNAFFNNTKIKKLILPPNIKELGWGAFHLCPNLEEVDCRYVKKIHDGAFNSCRKLKKFILPEHNIDFPYKDGFFESSSIEDIKLPTDLKEIGERWFFCCYELRHVDIPPNVKKIGSLAFSECKSLKTLIIPQSVEYIGSYAFRNCNNCHIIFECDKSVIDENVLREFNGTYEFR